MDTGRIINKQSKLYMCNHDDGEHGCCGKHGGGHEDMQMTKDEKVAHLEKTIAKLQKKVAAIKSGQDTKED